MIAWCSATSFPSHQERTQPYYSMRRSSMPPSRQKWAHATNTSSKLREALADPDVTAIEADLLMGREEETSALLQAGGGGGPNSTTTSSRRREGTIVPILSHPPERASDLSAENFLRQVTGEPLGPRSGKRHLEKHIKLDFKDLDAVEPTLKLLFKEIDVSVSERTVFLNADIVPGPGRSADEVNVPADHFIETCMELMSEESRGVVFSLGFTVDILHPFGHTNEHLDEMISLVRRHNLMNRSAGVVLAINARLLVKNMLPFETFLEHFPSSQLLAWTGMGEPPISQRKIDRIRKHFDSHGTLHRIGFDCKVAETFLAGIVYDVCFYLYGMFLFVVTIVSRAASVFQRQKEKQT